MSGRAGPGLAVPAEPRQTMPRHAVLCLAMPSQALPVLIGHAHLAQPKHDAHLIVPVQLPPVRRVQARE